MPEFEWVGSGAPSSTNFSTVGSGFTVNNAQGSGFDVQFTVTEIGPGFSEIQTSTSNVYDDTGTAPNTLGNDSLYLEGNGNGNGNDTLAVELQFFDTSSGDRDNVDGVEFFINDIDFASWDDMIIITAWTWDGTQEDAIPVFLTAQVPGNQDVELVSSGGDPADGYSIDANAITGNTVPTSANGSVLVQIPGNVHRVEIDYNNLGPGGQRIDVSNVLYDNAGIPCFTRGTQIRTDRGDVEIENLEVGDLILTKDNGFQPIRWIGSKTVSGGHIDAPIVFTKGAIGNAREFSVSPNHRMLLSGWRATLLFGERDVLVPAKALVNGETIYASTTRQIEYFHILFDAHQIIFAEQTPTESLYTGDYALEGLGAESRAEILKLFPELLELDQKPTPCYPIAKAYEAELVL